MGSPFTFKSEKLFKKLLADFWCGFSSAVLLFSHKRGLTHLKTVSFWEKERNLFSIDVPKKRKNDMLSSSLDNLSFLSLVECVWSRI